MRTESKLYFGPNHLQRETTGGIYPKVSPHRFTPHCHKSTDNLPLAAVLYCKCLNNPCILDYLVLPVTCLFNANVCQSRPGFFCRDFQESERTIIIGVALQRIEVSGMCPCDVLGALAIVVEDLGHAGLGYGKRRQEEHVCLLRMWLQQIKLTCCIYVGVCVYIYIWERETLTKIVYSQLHTEGFANQTNRTGFPQLPQFSPSFSAWALKFRLIFASGYQLLWKQNSLSRLTVSRLALLQIFVVAWTLRRCYQEVIRVLNKDRKQKGRTINVVNGFPIREIMTE